MSVLKSNSLPGFFGVPLYDIIVFILNELRRQKIFFRANSIAFSFFLSIFPALIVIINLLAYLPIEGVIDVLNNSLSSVLPEQAHTFLFGTIDDIVAKPRAGLLSLSFLLAIITSSNGMMAMMNSFDKAHSMSFKTRTGFQKRIRAIWLTAMLVLLLLISIALIIAGNSVMHWFAEILNINRDSNLLVISILKWLLIVGVFYTFIAAIYRYGVALNKPMNFLSPGTSVATILSILTSILFSFYINGFGHFNSVYGSIGAIIILLIWIQLNAFILLLGFELNASIAVNRDIKLMRVETEEPID